MFLSVCPGKPRRDRVFVGYVSGFLCQGKDTNLGGLLAPNKIFSVAQKYTHSQENLLWVFKLLIPWNCTTWKDEREILIEIYWRGGNFFTESWNGPKTEKRQYHISPSMENKENQRDPACGWGQVHSLSLLLMAWKWIES